MRRGRSERRRLTWEIKTENESEIIDYWLWNWEFTIDDWWFEKKKKTGNWLFAIEKTDLVLVIEYSLMTF